MSALYSEKVYAMTLAPPAPKERLQDVLQLVEGALPKIDSPAWSLRIYQYFKFLADSYDDLNLLAGENILVMPTHQGLVEVLRGPTVVNSAAGTPGPDMASSLQSGFLTRLLDKSDIYHKAIARAQQVCPPYFPDIAPALAILLKEPNVDKWSETLRQMAEAGPQMDAAFMLFFLNTMG